MPSNGDYRYALELRLSERPPVKQLAVLMHTDVLVAGWGNTNGLDPGRRARRIAEALTLLAPYPLYAVDAPTKLGHPRRALLWNGGAALARWFPTQEYGSGA